MATVRDAVAYLVANYPHKDELSKARVTKMVYLADWKAAIDHGRQITDIKWRFHHFGPYVDDVYRAAVDDPALHVKQEVNVYGNLKERIELVDPKTTVRLHDWEKTIFNHVISETKPMHWDGFIKLVYSTYPILSGVRGAPLDLIASARAYREIGSALRAGRR
ncbi:Panacea domain-containing protein [Rhizobium laguerreae]|uniref:SocA family protein n=1 Tax=Rhizobium laguerreae TaxID=1076926 RepID=A0A7Y2RB08_9HYPH|nr:Panacea domain-containing protein [Rhizobium laguerreae]NNH67522.1 SocA family protein [Rhizobium laguerreae]